jgi:hypothetical protein
VKFRHKTPVYQLYSRNYYKVIHSKICHNIIKAQVFVNILGRRYARTYKKPGFHSSLNYWHAIALIFPTSLAWAQLQLMWRRKTCGVFSKSTHAREGRPGTLPRASVQKKSKGYARRAHSSAASLI